MDKKELQHAYYLLNGFVANMENDDNDKDYLLELQRWFLDQMEIAKNKNVLHVKPCHAAEFNGIDCLEMEDKYGFFNSDHDVRPGHAIWIKKEHAERLFDLFINREKV